MNPLSKNFDPRTGTVSLIPKKPNLKPPLKKVSDPGPRGLYIQRTQEEMTRIERDKALQDELMVLGLFGEMQEQPKLEIMSPQLEVPETEVSTEEVSKVNIENIPLVVEEPKRSKRGRRKRS